MCALCENRSIRENTKVAEDVRRRAEASLRCLPLQASASLRFDDEASPPDIRYEGFRHCVHRLLRERKGLCEPSNGQFNVVKHVQGRARWSVPTTEVKVHPNLQV